MPEATASKNASSNINQVAAPSADANATKLSGAAADEPNGITPQIMSVIETAVTAYAGKNLRVLSVKVAGDSRPEPNRWADHGRNMIHASHNMIQRGH